MPSIDGSACSTCHGRQGVSVQQYSATLRVFLTSRICASSKSVSAMQVMDGKSSCSSTRRVSSSMHNTCTCAPGQWWYSERSMATPLNR